MSIIIAQPTLAIKDIAVKDIPIKEDRQGLSSKDDIFQSPVVYKTPAEIRTQWNAFLTKCINNSNRMPTKAGVCFALKIRRKEWETLRAHKTLGVAIDWIETVIEDAWLQKLISTGASAGAWNYLKSHYPEQYGDVPFGIGNTPIPIVNISMHYTAVQK